MGFEIVLDAPDDVAQVEYHFSTFRDVLVLEEDR
jgi:hypothetical protein